MDCPGRTGILQSFSSSRPKTPLLTPAPGAAETRARHPWRILAAPRLQRKPAPLGASDHIAQKSPRGVRPLAAAGAHCSRRTRRGWWGPRLWGHLLGRAGNGRNSSGASRKLDLALRYEFEDGGGISAQPCSQVYRGRRQPLTCTSHLGILINRGSAQSHVCLCPSPLSPPRATDTGSCRFSVCRWTASRTCLPG